MPDNPAVEVEIRARLDQLERDLARARGRVEQFDRSFRGGNRSLRELETFSSRAALSLRNLANQLSIFQGPLGPIAGRVSFLATGLGRVGVGGIAAGLGLTGMVIGAKKALDAFAALEARQVRYTAVIRATGGAAGKSAEDIENLALSIRQTSATTANSVRDAAAVLLTFRSISGDAFDETLRLAQDLAATGLGSITSSAIMLGKALEDPERGLVALRRVGVSFTETQKEMVKGLLETGDRAKAVDLILQGVAAQVKGVAAAQRDTITGAWNQFSEAIGDTFERLGELLDRSIKYREFLQWLADTFDESNAAASTAAGALKEVQAQLDALEKTQGRAFIPTGEMRAPFAMPVDRERAKALLLEKRAVLELDAAYEKSWHTFQQVAQIEDVLRERREQTAQAVEGALNKLKDEGKQLRMTAEELAEYKAVTDAAKNAQTKFSAEQEAIIRAQARLNYTLKNSSSILQQYTSLLGAAASVEQQVAARADALNEARKNGVEFTPKEVAADLERTRQRALGVDVIRQEADALRIEAATRGMSAGKAAEYKAVHDRLNQAARDGQKLTADQVAEIRREASALGAAASAAEGATASLDKLKVVQEALFERKLTFLSDDDVEIARKLAAALGDVDLSKIDVAALLKSPEAEVLRFNARLKETKEVIRDIQTASSDFFSSLVEGFAKGGDAAELLQSSLATLGDRLISIGSHQLGESLTKSIGGTIGPAISGALGLAGSLGGPIGSLAAFGVGALISVFTAKSKESDEAAKAFAEAQRKLAEAQQRWAAMADDFSSWIEDWTTGISNELAQAIASARSQLQSFVSAATEAQDFAAIAQANQAFNAGVVRSIGEAFDELVNFGLESDTIAQQFDDAQKKADDLRQVLIDFGTSAEDAAIAVETRLTVAIQNLRDAIEDDLIRKINSLAGGDWINQLTDLVDEIASLQTNAPNLGGLIDTYFVLAAQKIIDEAQLTGNAFNAVAATLGPLGESLHEFVAATEEAAETLTRSAEEIASTIQNYQDQLFTAQQDASTLTGALAIFDLQAQRAREQELAAGGEAIAALTALQEQQRLNIIADFNARALAEQKRAIEEQQRLQQQAYNEQIRTLQQVIDQQERFIESLRDFKDSLAIDAALSPLSPAARLQAAQRQFQTTAASAAAGNINAQGDLQSIARAYLDAARDFYGSSYGYVQIFQAVNSTLDSVLSSAESQLSDSELQLTELEHQTQLLTTIAANTSGGAVVDTSFLSNLPGYASGTSFARGGLSIVGERGPELISIPRGARVTPVAGNDNADVVDLLTRILDTLAAGERINAQESAGIKQAISTLSRRLSARELSRSRDVG